MSGGWQVTLVSTDHSVVTDQEKQEFFSRQFVSNPFEIISLRSFGRTITERQFLWARKLEMFFSNMTLIRWLLKQPRAGVVIYCRDPFLYPVAWFAKKILKLALFFEIHAVLHKPASQRLVVGLARISEGIIVISRALADHYQVLHKPMIVSFCSAAEPERFAHIQTSAQDLRRSLGLPSDKIILGYTGNLSRTGNNDSYGIEDIISALPLLPPDYIFIGVGKRGNDTNELEQLSEQLGVADRVVFVPWVKKEIVAQYIKAFDLLVIPAAGAQIGNSPTKIFEYLVSGLPIVAAQTQAIAEILVSERNALLVDYKDPQSWTSAIERLVKDQPLKQHIVAQAQADGQIYTWGKRGQDITGFIAQHQVNYHEQK
jgi:glycosyltransferase involved in cell wall biosynthesis